MSQQFENYLKDVGGFAQSLSKDPIVKEAMGKAEWESQDQLKIIEIINKLYLLLHLYILSYISKVRGGKPEPAENYYCYRSIYL